MCSAPRKGAAPRVVAGAAGGAAAERLERVVIEVREAGSAPDPGLGSTITAARLHPGPIRTTRKERCTLGQAWPSGAPQEPRLSRHTADDVARTHRAHTTHVSLCTPDLGEWARLEPLKPSPPLRGVPSSRQAMAARNRSSASERETASPSVLVKLLAECVGSQSLPAQRHSGRVRGPTVQHLLRYRPTLWARHIAVSREKAASYQGERRRNKMRREELGNRMNTKWKG